MGAGQQENLDHAIHEIVSGLATGNSNSKLPLKRRKIRHEGALPTGTRLAIKNQGALP